MLDSLSYIDRMDRKIDRWLKKSKPQNKAHDADDVIRSDLHPAQIKIRDEAGRFNAVRCGRRFGKDVLMMDMLIDRAMSGMKVAWFAPIYKDLVENWRSAENILANAIARSNSTEKRMELSSGGVIDMWSLDNKDSGRGRKYHRVIINEASKVKDLQYSWEYVIRPSLADYKGDAFIAGTPKGFNYFATLCKLAEREANWREFHFTSYDNPYIDPAELDELKRTLPDRVYRQEILAEFVEDGAYFQNVANAATITQPDTPDQHAGHVFGMGVDWAKHNDFTVMVVSCRECNRAVDWMRFNQIDYNLQRERLRQMQDKWKTSLIIPESNSIGEPNIEVLANDGLPVEGFATTATSKPPLIEALQLGLLNGYRIPREFADEFYSYEVITRKDGRSSFSAPSGLHDDTVIATALSYRAISQYSTAIIGW